MLPLQALLLPDAGTSYPLLLHANVLLPAECSQHHLHAAPVQVFPTPDTSHVLLLQGESGRLYDGCASCCGKSYVAYADSLCCEHLQITLSDKILRESCVRLADLKYVSAA